MPGNTKSTVGRSGVQPVARVALVALACMALASCGGGPGAAHPDLAVKDPAVSDDHPTAGERLTFSATVRNAGRGNAAATMLRVYRSDDETITTDDKPVANATVAELAASESRGASVTVMAPPSPGTFYYGACVEPVARESDTANNCSAAVRVTVPAQDTKPPPPRPDLVVESLSVSGDVPTAGASFTLSATVRNAGHGSAAATKLRVYRSDDEIKPADEEVGAVTVAGLAALASRAASVTVAASSSPGTFSYRACADPVAEESDPANNCSAAIPVTVQAPQVTVAGPARPDLVVNRFWVNTASPAIGGVFELQAIVRNRGATTPHFTKLRFYRSTDATITWSDTEVATSSVHPLSIYSDDFDGYVYLYVMAPSTKGTYYYGGCVEAVAGESAVTNNCSAAVKVEVLHDRPDLKVTAWGAGRGQVGKTSSVATGVTNVGSPSDATTLRLLRVPERKSKPSAGTEVGQVDVPKLIVTGDAAAVSIRHVEFQAPATPGWYYYVMCVDAVPRETNTANNCSTGAKVEFR